MMPFEALQKDLDSLQRGTLDVASFCRHVRAEPLPPELPPRYAQVLGDLLDRLEASALFAGESCSFSQADLISNLQLWIDKARERLAR